MSRIDQAKIDQKNKKLINDPRKLKNIAKSMYKTYEASRWV